jgi:hypothetical protein
MSFPLLNISWPAVFILNLLPFTVTFPVNTLLITGGAIIILGAGALLLSRIRRTNLKSTVEKKVTVYAKIDYGQQQLNAESILPDVVAGKSDLSIRLLPDIGVQEIQGKGSLVKSE